MVFKEQEFEQDFVTQSTTEPEFVDAIAIINQVFWIRKILGDLHMK